MATPNFTLTNTNGIYIFVDAYEYENENGEIETYIRDNYDYNIIIRDLRHYAQELFPNKETSYVNMEGQLVCASNPNWLVYGKKQNAYTTETALFSSIFMVGGRYWGANLDYDITLHLAYGGTFYLSQYNNIDELLDDYFDTLTEIVEEYGQGHKWNVGTLKINQYSIKKWMRKEIQNEINKCENFCKTHCEKQLAIYAQFSNGETLYTEA